MDGDHHGGDPGSRRPAADQHGGIKFQTMTPGSIVDLAAETGGNCEPTKAGETVDVNGVQVIGPVNLAATMPNHASAMLSRNILTFVQHVMTKDGTLNIDRADEITGAMIVTGRTAK